MEPRRRKRLQKCRAVTHRDVVMLEPTSAQEEGAQAPAKRLGGTSGKGWMPGKSGNPKGMSREQAATAKVLREAAAKLTLPLLREASAIALDRAEPTANRLRAIEIVVGTGHADALRGAEGVDGELRIIVQPLVAEPRPTPGVLTHPDSRFIALPAAMQVREMVEEVKQ